MLEIFPEIVVAHRCFLGEGPVWDHFNERLIWTDIEKKTIHTYNPCNGSIKSTVFEKKIGAICLKSGGGYVAAVEDGFAELTLETGFMKMQVEMKEPGNRFNDGKCDALGRFWAGTLSMNDLPCSANLYSLNTGFKMQKRLRNVSVSNGMAWSLNNRIFYYIDTPTKMVVSYDFDIIKGGISNKKIVFRITHGYPDGMTIDDEGMLWIAIWDGGKVIRINPISGKQIAVVLFPVSRVTSCVFGGRNLTDLYVTTASAGLTNEELRLQPLAGGLFVIKGLSCKGIKAFEYKE